jgi:hypothetical protein
MMSAAILLSLAGPVRLLAPLSALRLIHIQ